MEAQFETESAQVQLEAERLYQEWETALGHGRAYRARAALKTLVENHEFLKGTKYDLKGI